MKNILVVDDSAVMRSLVSATLKQMGHQSAEAIDGNSGLDLARKTKFDLIITDINMAGMDGLEFTRQLRKMAQYKFSPILILTTESAADRKSEGKAAGATGWIIKPFQPETLINTVNKVLG